DSRLSSAGRHLMVLDLILAEGDQAAPEHALAVFAARIDRGGAAELNHTAGFMDMPVQTQERLMLLDRLAHGGAAGAVEHDLPTLHDLARRIGLPIQHRTSV